MLTCWFVGILRFAQNDGLLPFELRWMTLPSNRMIARPAKPPHISEARCGAPVFAVSCGDGLLDDFDECVDLKLARAADDVDVAEVLWLADG